MGCNRSIDKRESEKEKVMVMEFKNFIFDSDGSIDVDTTVNQFRIDLEKFKAERGTESAEVAAAVAAVFDKYKGAPYSLTMDCLVSAVFQELGGSAPQFKVYSERISEYVRNNAAPHREDGKLFQIKKGKGGGVRRWAEVPEEKK